jgi:hypothetical protein
MSKSVEKRLEAQGYTTTAPINDAEFKEWYLKYHGVELHLPGQGCKSCDRWRELTRQAVKCEARGK